VATHSNSSIRNMFADNGDGTFTVRFFNGTTPFYVTVNRMLPTTSTGNTAVYADWSTQANGTVNYSIFNSNNELWVALAEKAYAQVNESGWIGQDGRNSYVGIEFGFSSRAFSQLTGRATSSFDVDSSPTGFINYIRAGRAMSLSSKDTVSNSLVVENHCYMVIGYNEGTQRFELFNPWGLDSGADKPATLFLTWSQIRANFDGWTSLLP
jgi:hypothetical protein